MKILMSIKKMENMAGGAERVFCTLANGLYQGGHEISLISLDDKTAKSFYPLCGDIPWKKLGLTKDLKKLSPLSFMQALFSLRKIIIHEKPDVIIAFMHSMFVATAFATIGTGIPVVASEHIVPEHYKKRMHEFFLFAVASFFIEKITVISEEVKKLYPAFIQRKTVPIPNPVSFYDVPNNRRNKVILNIGRFTQQKGQVDLIHAFALIAPDFPDWKLRIVGDGTMRPSLESLVKSYALEDRIEMPGIIKDIQNEYSHASLYVVSSLYESFGLATAEAMSTGIPAIGFGNCPGTNEIIEHNVSGLLLEGEDRALALERGIRKLLSSETLRTKMGECARTRIATVFGKDVLDSWQSLLQDVVRK
jgi:glycosyltransferase involved in cell wall biosynthesis